MHLAQESDGSKYSRDRSNQPFHKPFCPGEAGAVGLSRMPMARNRHVTMLP
jgi:hypothetical protein